ncbi:restriction endonuclease subunit S [Ruegeria faecimaris]|uniref:Type I restriction enzyme, S subunit n=1 Tax=Ruegeria faecimaris TaxID=686389 RepID=A0A521FIU1_9RHOB|nr:restriction endonuclease subunit S [Ruegeria faecimaris]SMO96088.1 type I restriction enzyme, S subunit [Ruegeria faecimaris]
MSWAEFRLDEIGTVSRGRSRHRPRDAEHLYGGPYPFVQTGDVKHAGLYLTDYSQTYSEAGLAQSKLWPVGTLCITIAANIAETSILDIEACFPDSVIGFIPDEEKSDAKFIKYMFDALLKKRFRAFTQGAAQDNLSQGKLLSLTFPVPDVWEQKRIAEVLSAYDDLIENNRRRIALLEEAARQLYKEWFVHFRFPGHEHVPIVDGVPEGWANLTVADLGLVVTGKTPSKKQPENFGSDIPFIKTPDMHGQSIIIVTEECLSERGAETQTKKTLPARSILVSCIGTVGVTSMNATEAQTNQQINAVVPNETCSRYFAFFALEALKPRLEAIGGGVTMANVNKSKFSSLPVIVPNKILMDQFDETTVSIFDQVEKLSLQNRSLAQARDLLLPKLMSGEVTV